MNRLFFILVFSIVCLSASAQVNVVVTPSGSHWQVLDIFERARNARFGSIQTQLDSIPIIKADTSLARKEKRKRIRQIKQRIKDEKQRMKAYLKEQADQQLEMTWPDSISKLPKTAEDSMRWALQVLAMEQQYEQILAWKERYTSIDSAQFENLDSLAVVQLEQRQQLIESFIPEDVKKDLARQADIPDLDAANDLMPDLPEDAMPHQDLSSLLEDAPAPNIDGAVEQITNLKAKYSSLPDTRNMEGGIKKNSLKRTPVQERFFIGGNINVLSTDPIVFDTDLRLGFRINKKLSIGGTLRWREAFTAADSIAKVSKSSHGYAGFVSYDIAAGFFGYAEYSMIRPRSLFTESNREVNWQNEYLLGIGRTFDLFRFMELNMVILYDFNHKNNNINPRPFVIRVGYLVTKLPWKR